MCQRIPRIIILALVIPHMAWAQDTLRFGPVRIGASQVDTLCFPNDQAVRLMVDRAELHSGVFEVIGAPFSGALTRLDPGESRSIPIRFTPREAADFSGRLSIYSDHGIADRHISGSGVPEVVVIDEILADPPSGFTGDANGDGTRSSSADEFVELLNTGRYPIEISGWQLSDRKTSTSNRFSFPANTWIEPGGYVVLFGGGTGPRDGAFFDDGKIGGGLSNSGDAVYLFDASGRDTLARASYGREGGRDQSLVRGGDGQWALHTEFPGIGDRFSPGRVRETFLRLSLERGDTSIAVGDTLSTRAVGETSHGNRADLTPEVAWAAEPSGILKHLGNGVWVGLSAGRVAIGARLADLVSNSATVRIDAGRMDLVGLRVAPRDTTVLKQDVFSVTAVGVCPSGKEVELDRVSYDIQNPEVVAGVGGRFTAIGIGQSAVSATHSGYSASMVVRVAESGDLDADGAVALVDAVRSVHIVANKPPPPSAFELRSADLDANDVIDVRDVILIVDKMLEFEGHSKPARMPLATWRRESACLVLEAAECFQLVCVQVEKGRVLLGKIEGARSLSRRSEGGWEMVITGETHRGILGKNGPLALNCEDRALAVRQIMGLTISGYPVVFQQSDDTLATGLLQIHPNPFNPTVHIGYHLGQRQRITLSIFNVLGQEVARLVDAVQMGGTHSAVWDGRDHRNAPVASGIYLASLKGIGFSSARKLIFIK